MSDLDFELDIHKYSPTELEGLFFWVQSLSTIL